MPDPAEQPPDAPVVLPIEGELDLHTFRPQDVKEVVTNYLEACRAKGILETRIVHGKGIGQLRQTVHAVLARLPTVASYAIAGDCYGGTGATMVHLRRETSADAPPSTLCS
jgi:DNA-nicking Smr family endonuclease